MRIMVIPCDGIGPEIIEASMNALSIVTGKAGLTIQFDYE